MHRSLLQIPTVLLAVAVLLMAGCSLKPERSLVLATTTSTYDTGLLDAIVPAFEEMHNVKVRVIAVGTGQALALGSRGDADVLLIHDPKREEQFVADGLGADREYVMYNDFVVLGPPEDPARIRGLTSASEAFQKIAEAEADFASRGDESGTHVKEKDIWSEAGLPPLEKEGWYFSLGQGMGETLTTANEMGAYTLSDRGTFLARPEMKLEILVEGDEVLFNPYHVMIVNTEKFPNVQSQLARLFVEYLISPDTQKAIGEFGREKFGQALFIPVRLTPAPDN